MKNIFFCFIVLMIVGCNKNQTEQKKANIPLATSDTIPQIDVVIASQPKVTFLDTVPKPQKIAPIGSVSQIIISKNGLTYKLEQTKTEPAVFFNYMPNYNTEEGLALSSVSCGYKDKQGNLWFGTQGGGVSRYDGKSFSNYATSQGLANNVVWCITQDVKGNMWFGTKDGVSCYDGKSFTRFDISNGKTTVSIRSIFEDRAGNIWFGTLGGGVTCYHPSNLNNPNKKLFTTYTTAEGLANNSVFSILQDKKGNMWFGTFGGGISKYDPVAAKSGKMPFKNYTVADGLASNEIFCMIEDRKGNLWCGTNSKGLSVYDGKKFTNYLVDPKGPSIIRAITEDKKGIIWIGTYKEGAYRYDPSLGSSQSFTRYSVAEGLSNDFILCITEDKQGNLWFGTQGGGISLYSGSSFTHLKSFVWKAFIVKSITEDRVGNMWFAIKGSGVMKYDGKNSYLYRNQGLPSMDVLNITEDKRGNLWFGTLDGGISCFDGKSYTNYSTDQGLPDNCIISVFEDKRGNMWFGTQTGGVCRYDGNRVEAIEKGEKFYSDAVKDLKKLNGKFVKTVTCYNTPQGLSGNSVKCIAEDSLGNIWFGTQSGASRFNGNRVDAAENGEINSNRGKDLKKVNGKFVKSFTNFTTDNGLANNAVKSIITDKKGNLWFVTDHGLSYYELNSELKTKKCFQTYTIANGLTDDFVTQVRQDNAGRIVLGTNKGIMFFNPNLPLDSNGMLPQLEVYNTTTGYPIKDVNPGQGTLIIDKKGIIWAATGDDKTGLVRFDRSALNYYTEPPAVLIQSIQLNEEKICWNDLSGAKFKIQDPPVKNNTGKNALSSFTNYVSGNVTEEVSVFGRSLTQGERENMQKKFANVRFDSIARFYPVPQKLILPHEQNNITIEYAAIEPAKPYLVNYQYILEGYDKNWSPVTKKTNATFGNMYEGTYTFKLKAQSPEGIWSEPITYIFQVLPPWYRTWWAYCLYTISGLGLLFGFYRWRTASLRHDKEILEQTVLERTAEVVVQKEAAEKQKEIANEQKKMVEVKHKEITDSINYAERIQRSFLASQELLDKNLKEHFVFFKPKDVVSGDFYWAAELSKSSFALVTADSTGHGVPGAIMSILNISSIEKAVEQGLSKPSEIFDYTRKIIIERLKKDGSRDGGKDGMDASIICFDFQNNKFSYAAANNPIYIVRENRLIELKPDKMPIGKNDKDEVPFTENEFQIEKHDVVYTLTDGFADQFGGPEGKKFMSKRLKELLISISCLPMDEQKQILHTKMNDWMGNIEQVDDITVIGIRI